MLLFTKSVKLVPCGMHSCSAPAATIFRNRHLSGSVLGEMVPWLPMVSPGLAVFGDARRGLLVMVRLHALGVRTEVRAGVLTLELGGV